MWKGITSDLFQFNYLIMSARGIFFSWKCFAYEFKFLVHEMLWQSRSLKWGEECSDSYFVNLVSACFSGWEGRMKPVCLYSPFCIWPFFLLVVETYIDLGKPSLLKNELKREAFKFFFFLAKASSANWILGAIQTFSSRPHGFVSLFSGYYTILENGIGDLLLFCLGWLTSNFRELPRDTSNEVTCPRSHSQYGKGGIWAWSQPVLSIP